MIQNLIKESPKLSPEIEEKLIKSLQALPEQAQEPIVDNNFIATLFFEALGFSLQERIPGFKTGDDKKAVDYALRHNIDNDNFLHTQKNPYLLVELKGRDINLKYGTLLQN